MRLSPIGPDTPATQRARSPLARIATLTLLLILAACGSVQRQAPAPTPPAPQIPPPAPAPAPPVTTAPLPEPARPPAVATPTPQARTVSQATSPLAYRRDAATHVYALNAERIYKGKLQPMLYAIGVLEVDINASGQVVGINWRRAPSHAPEVMAEIVRTVRAAAPYPVPARMGRVTWTDVWLWDKSGRFQLDTLTEGQL